jgi:hypothetical protein
MTCAMIADRDRSSFRLTNQDRHVLIVRAAIWLSPHHPPVGDLHWPVEPTVRFVNQSRSRVRHD